jgi:Spy/CpxP family protein refolding chaperone
MKLNKTLMIAALVAGSVFAADMAVLAQDSSNTPPAGARPPAGRGRMNFDSISTQLALTDDQKTKAKPVFDEMMTKMADLRKDTSMDATERRAKMKEIRDDATTKLKDILTPEQLDKWQKLNQGGRRPPGGAGTPPPAGGTPPPPPADKTQQ